MNVLVLAIAGFVRQIRLGELRSQLAEIASQVLQTGAISITRKVLLTLGVKIVKNSLR